MKFSTTLGEHFAATIECELDSDGDLVDITVRSAETGQDITALIYGSQVWEQAWERAQAHLANDSHIRAARFQAALNWNQPIWGYA